ncbi:MAG: NAD(P)/FAD-dependent oxidoreductase [Pseudomonadota bacterium]
MARDLYDYETVVVGAGAAGLAATHRLHKAGRQVLCLESSERIGGRCHTDTSVFGVPFDMGGHWLHYADINSFIPIGQELGFDLYPAADHYRHAGADVSGVDLLKEFEAIDARLARSAENEPDISMAEALVPQNGMERSVLLSKTLSLGRDLSEISVKAWHDGLDKNNWFCRQGFGAIVARHAEGLPVKLNTPVTAITRTPDGVEIDTSDGKITAAHVIVTVSVGILASEAIRFDPPLETARLHALDGITMGIFNHAGLLFDPGTLPVEPDTWLSYDLDEISGDYAPGGSFLCNISGSGLTSFIHIGNFAKELETADGDAATDFALARLIGIFGSDIRKGFRKGHTTRWGQNPHTRGAYSGTRPGADGLHRDLRPVHAEVIHFAGEAMNEAERVCVSGAHKEGLRAADEILAVL